jgi:hypothetical protein
VRLNRIILERCVFLGVLCALRGYVSALLARFALFAAVRPTFDSLENTPFFDLFRILNAFR